MTIWLWVVTGTLFFSQTHVRKQVENNTAIVILSDNDDNANDSGAV